MFVAIKLAAWIILSTVFTGYAMDVPDQQKVCSPVGWECELAKHIVNRSCNLVDSRGKDIKERVGAMQRIYATSDRGDIYHHQGMVDGGLKSFKGKNCAWVHDKDMMIAHKDENNYSINIIPMRLPIKSAAFNDNGLVFACVSDQELVVADLHFGDYLSRPQVRLGAQLSGIQHVALSDSGNRVAVGIKKSHDLRVMVFDTQKQQLLHNLSGRVVCGDFRFFYMMGENIVASCFNQQNMQYDLSLGEKYLTQLTKEQKGFLYTIYEYYNSQAKRIILQCGTEAFDIYLHLPKLAKEWVRKYVSLRSLSIN
jgi:hypothetical protein